MTRSGSCAPWRVPAGAAVRPPAWNPTGDLETLGPPRVTARGDSVEIAYPVVVWLAGSRTVDVPGPLLLLAGGGVDSIPSQRVTVTVASILPAGVPESLLQIQPAAQPVVRGERTLRPLLALLAAGGDPAAAGALAVAAAGEAAAARPCANRAAGPAARALGRRGRSARRARRRDGVTARCHCARGARGGHRRGRAAGARGRVRAANPEWPHDEIADVLGALEEARFRPRPFPMRRAWLPGRGTSRSSCGRRRRDLRPPPAAPAAADPSALVVAAPGAPRHRALQ